MLKNHLRLAQLTRISTNSNKNYRPYNFQALTNISGKFTTLIITTPPQKKLTVVNVTNKFSNNRTSINIATNRKTIAIVKQVITKKLKIELFETQCIKQIYNFSSSFSLTCTALS